MQEIHLFPLRKHASFGVCLRDEAPLLDFPVHMSNTLLDLATPFSKLSRFNWLCLQAFALSIDFFQPLMCRERYQSRWCSIC